MRIQLQTRRHAASGDRPALMLAGASLLLAVVAGAISVAAVAKPVPAPVSKPGLTPEAKAALSSMGTYLRSLKSFEVTADGTGDVAQDGQSLEYDARLRYVVALPDRMFAEVSTGSQQRQLYYDGLKLTVSAPEINYYADMPLSGSLAVLLDRAAAEYGIELPLHQLFLWGDAKRPVEWPTSGFKVGTTRCGVAICDQYAFRQPGLDYGMSSARRDWLHMLSFAVTMTITLYLIIDLEYPRLGLIDVASFERAAMATAGIDP
ncbi:DUF2092 domain-containing protein [Glacieibacterium frigidum]|uniref:DUF2092 domain-containing protein n=1 Tax=Glacieibacterium frigidum TaxID=2593303 RepID=A0A552U986_9SPHN|nr:DUF2092 domain-containing protein [Glacieibacterium frigidum]TRW14775.1 DUF2092 domain-containing protein [Glacieibacterium frigidum]